MTGVSTLGYPYAASCDGHEIIRVRISRAGLRFGRDICGYNPHVDRARIAIAQHLGIPVYYIRLKSVDEDEAYSGKWFELE